MKRAFLALLPLAACGEPAGADAQLLVPDAVELHWDDAFNGADDGVVALVPVDFMVYGRLNGEPLAGVGLDVQVLDGDAGLVDPQSVDWAEADDCDACDLLWDTHRDRGFAFVDDEASAVRASLRLSTDDSGLARAYVLVDSYGASEGGAEAYAGSGGAVGAWGAAAPISVVVRAPGLPGAPVEAFELLAR